jgi:hypothetical protein
MLLLFLLGRANDIDPAVEIKPGVTNGAPSLKLSIA